MTRRTAKLAAVYLLLGLVATWAVAWGSAAWVDLRSLPNGLERRAPFRVIERAAGFGGAWVSLSGWGNRASANFLESLPAIGPSNTDSWPPHFPKLIDMPGFAASALPTRPPDGTVSSQTSPPALVVNGVEARGWPWPALRALLLDTSTPGPNSMRSVAEYDQRRGGFQVDGDGWQAAPFTGKRGFPYLPYWPGLLANTLFYALLFATLHQLAAYARRTRRRRRNRCTACGYDLQGLNAPTCPECGRALSPARGATARPDRA